MILSEVEFFDRSPLLKRIGKILSDKGQTSQMIEGLSLAEMLRKPPREFDLQADNSCVYGLIVLRALFGKQELKEFPTIRFDAKEIDISAIEFSESKFETGVLIGADLVARMVLDLLRQIIKATTETMDRQKTIGFGLDYSHLDIDGMYIDFVSADFVRVRKCGIAASGVSEVAYELGDWHNFGWQHPSEKGMFGAVANKDDLFSRDNKSGKIESFLVRPQFYEDPEAAFCALYDGEYWRCSFDPNELSSGTTGKAIEQASSLLYENGVKPFLDFKALGNRNSHGIVSENAARIVFCAAIANQGGASFHRSLFNQGLGVFSTIDIYNLTGDGAKCPSACSLDKDELIASVCSIRNLTRFRMAQTLNALIYLEMESQKSLIEEQNESLAKSDAMLGLMRLPLKSITDALAIIQGEAQELRSILYDPMEAIFSCQPRIADLFREETVPGMTTAHNIESLEVNDKRAVLTLALRRIRGNEETSITPTFGLTQEVLLFHSYESSEEEKSGSFLRLAKRVRKVLDPEIGSWLDVLDNVNGITTESAENFLNSCLGNLKYRFLTIYKTQTSSGFLTAENVLIFLDDLIHMENVHYEGGLKIWFLARKSNPLSTHGHFIEFVRAIVRQHCVSNRHSRIKLHVINEHCSLQPLDKERVEVKLQSENPDDQQNEGGSWIMVGNNMEMDFNAFIEKQITLHENNGRDQTEYGDFHGAFVKLFARIPQGIAIRKEQGDGKEIRIIFGKRFRITFCDQCFSIESGCLIETEVKAE